MDEKCNRIQEILDEALLNDQALLRFEEVLPEIKNYECVDSAWIDGPVFWVQFRDGGKQFWKATPEGKNTNSIDINP